MMQFLKLLRQNIIPLTLFCLAFYELAGPGEGCILLVFDPRNTKLVGRLNMPGVIS